jgi:transcriptional regulator with XRE-family HTH domain
MSAMSFAERLKALRESAHLTQPELAARAGMNRFGIAKLEQGVREPSWATVQALAMAAPPIPKCNRRQLPAKANRPDLGQLARRQDHQARRQDHPRAEDMESRNSSADFRTSAESPHFLACFRTSSTDLANANETA